MTPSEQNAAAATSGDPKLDALILESADGEWRHVALLIARATDACNAASYGTSAQAIAARIYALAAEGKLASQGNIRRWRAGKIRAAGILHEPSTATPTAISTDSPAMLDADE